MRLEVEGGVSIERQKFGSFGLRCQPLPTPRHSSPRAQTSHEGKSRSYPKQSATRNLAVRLREPALEERERGRPTPHSNFGQSWNMHPSNMPTIERIDVSHLRQSRIGRASGEERPLRSFSPWAQDRADVPTIRLALLTRYLVS